MTKKIDVNYKYPKTIGRFHKSDAFYRGLMGPVGSGKSTACCWEIIRRSQQQSPDSRGIRKTRWAIVRNCYDDQTEILTEKRGWQLFKNLTEDDRVAMLEGDETVFVEPSFFYSADYVGEMIGFKNESLDFLVTPDHKLSVSMRNARKKEWSEYRLRKASDCYGKTNMRVRRSASKWKGSNQKYSEEMFEWLGYWFAEGSTTVKEYDGSLRHNCIISTKNDLPYAKRLFKNANLPYSLTSDSGCYRLRLLANEDTKGLIRQLDSCGKAINKKIPVDWKNAPQKHLQAFIKGYLAGDGSHRQNNTTICAVTSSQCLANDLQEIGLKAGYVVNINATNEIRSAMVINGVETKQNAPSICITFLNEEKYNPHLTASGRYPGWYRKTYKGKVYCVEVPSHIVYVRRNGRAFWCSQTYRELLDTTVQTWKTWFPGDLFGEVKPSTMSQAMRFQLEDKTFVDAEIMFRALDRPDDVKKVLSLEITGAWVNEAREVPKAIIDGLGDRSGRFPSMKDGGCTWRGVMMDTNPPDEDHWWYRLCEEERPPGWEFFKQPGGLIEVSPGIFEPNPAAENLKHLEPDYYLTRSYGKTPEYIRIYYCGQYGFVADGKPVFPEYVDALHAAHQELEPTPGLPIDVGLDFGLTPAAVFTQRQANGSWIWFDELVSDDMGILRFGKMLGPLLRGKYAGLPANIWGDPSGSNRAQTDERTCFQILKQLGINARPAPTNDFTLRREALARPLSRIIDGEPGFKISPRAKITRKGLAGGYRFRRLKVAGDERYHDSPEKNQYSHPVEGGCYAMLGAGEGREITRGPQKPVKKDYMKDYQMPGGWML